jgi:hypothetical protein
MHGDGIAPEAPPSELIVVPHYGIDRIKGVLSSAEVTAITQLIAIHAAEIGSSIMRVTLSGNTVRVHLNPELTEIERGLDAASLHFVILNAVHDVLGWRYMRKAEQLATARETAFMYWVIPIEGEEDPRLEAITFHAE